MNSLNKLESGNDDLLNQVNKIGIDNKFNITKGRVSSGDQLNKENYWIELLNKNIIR